MRQPEIDRFSERHSPLTAVRARDKINTRRIFAAEFRAQMNRYGDTTRSLLNAIDPANARNRHSTINQWRRGAALPRFGTSFGLLKRIEKRYGLPSGYFLKLATPPLSETAKLLRNIHASEQVAVRYHLPRSFEKKSPAQRAEIVAWINANVLGCNTEYGRYMRIVNPLKYSLRFPELPHAKSSRPGKGTYIPHSKTAGRVGGYGNLDAPKRLSDELADLITFRTAPLPPLEMSR
jgi:hypothetical protein